MKLRGTSKVAPVAFVALSLLLSACGKEQFHRLEEKSVNVAGQYNVVRPKLDVVVFQDKSDSTMNGPINVLKPQMQSFLSSLSTSWDYRFIVLPLQSQQSINSKYVVAVNCTGVPAGGCLSPSDAGAFNNAGGDSGWINSRDTNGTINNMDYGFENMKQSLSMLTNVGYLRPDAVLATMVVSNGEDVSGGVGYSTRSDGVQVIDYNSSTTQASFNYYYNFFSGLKGSTQLNRFYSVVAAQRYSNCYGGMSFMGKRYMDMAGSLGGLSYDLCSGQLNSALYDISNRLKTVVQVIEFDYVVLDSEPYTTSTMKVYKNGSLVSSANWQYVGYRTNQATSFYPSSGNYRDGYMIKLLNGVSYKGSDVVTVDFQRK